MADFLSEKDWGAEIKALKITKDGGLKDALAEWAKVKGKSPDEQLEAIEAVIEAAQAAQKLLKAEKDLVKFAATTETKAEAELARIEKDAADAGEDGAVDKELYAALKHAKTAPMFAAVVAMGSTDGKLLMSKMKIKPGDVSEAKKAAGGGTVYRAATHVDSGVYIFELTKEPPATLAQLIKKLAKTQAGLMIRVECRVGTNLDLGDDEAEQKPQEGVSSQQTHQTVNKLAEEYHQKVNQLTPLAKKAITEKRIDPATVSRLLQAAQTAATGGDYAKGLQELKALEDSLSQALGAQTAQPEEPSAEDEKAAFDARLKTVGADLLIHLKANPDDRADLTDLLHEARDAGDQQNFAGGHKLLDRIERIVIAAKRAARGAEMAQQIPEGAGSSGALDADRIETVIAAWTAARESAVSGAATLAEMLRDSEYDDLHPIADYVDELVDGFPDRLDATLDELRVATVQSDTPRVKQFQGRSKTEIKACLDYLNTNSNLIEACEQHPLGGPAVTIAGPLRQSLRSILELVK